MRLLFDKLLALKAIKWYKILEDLGSLKSTFNKVILVITDGLTKELCVGAHLVAKQVVYLNRKSEPLFTALYLKQAAVCLKQAYAGVPGPKGKLPVPVSLSGSGYPRIIPSFHRTQMLKKDDKADVLVKLYLSYFSLCRLIRLAKKVEKSILKSIASPLLLGIQTKSSHF